MVMLLHEINQAALVQPTDNSGNSCNMRVRLFIMKIFIRLFFIFTVAVITASFLRSMM